MEDLVSSTHRERERERERERKRERGRGREREREREREQQQQLSIEQNNVFEVACVRPSSEEVCLRHLVPP